MRMQTESNPTSGTDRSPGRKPDAGDSSRSVDEECGPKEPSGTRAFGAHVTKTGTDTETQKGNIQEGGWVLGAGTFLGSLLGQKRTVLASQDSHHDRDLLHALHDAPCGSAKHASARHTVGVRVEAVHESAVDSGAQARGSLRKIKLPADIPE